MKTLIASFLFVSTFASASGDSIQLDARCHSREQTSLGASGPGRAYDATIRLTALGESTIEIQIDDSIFSHRTYTSVVSPQGQGLGRALVGRDVAHTLSMRERSVRVQTIRMDRQGITIGRGGVVDTVDLNVQHGYGLVCRFESPLDSSDLNRIIEYTTNN